MSKEYHPLVGPPLETTAAPSLQRLRASRLSRTVLRLDHERNEALAEVQRLRTLLMDTLTQHATDPDHPCGECQWRLDEETK